MWEPVFLSDAYIFERQLGFSIPQDNHILIIAYEGICLMDMAAPYNSHLDYEYPEGKGVYDPDSQVATYGGRLFQILGLYGGAPILHSDRGEHVTLDLESQVLWVQQSDGTTTFEFRFDSLSDDWGYVTFSPTFSAMVLGLPYDLYIFRRA